MIWVGFLWLKIADLLPVPKTWWFFSYGMKIKTLRIGSLLTPEEAGSN